MPLIDNRRTGRTPHFFLQEPSMPDAPRPGPEPPESESGGQPPGNDGEFPEEERVLAGEDVIKEVFEAIIAVERNLAPGSFPETAEERIDRLAVDVQIVELLKTEDFDGPLFKRLAGRMVGYGWPIMMKWLGTGEIFQRSLRCRGQITRHQADQDWTADDRSQIAMDTVLEGVDVFRRQLQAGRWDPQKGASLKTYFIGSCVCAFSKVYGLWRREQTLTDGVLHYAYLDDLEAAKVTVQRRVADPEESAVIGDLVDRAIQPMRDSDLRRIVGLRAIGFTQREAADETGITEKAAERRLAKYRRQLDACNPEENGLGEVNQ